MTDRSRCPECGEAFERLASHWTHPAVDCEAPEIDDYQRPLLDGMALAAASVAGNGTNRYLETGTTSEPLATWLAAELGWLCQSVRTDERPDAQPQYRVRTVAHPGLNRYDRWGSLPESRGRAPPNDFDLTPTAARVWWAVAGGLEWAGPHDSQRRGAFSALHDDRAAWIERVLADAGFETVRVDKRVRLEPTTLDRWLTWIGEPVPGAEHKWADSLILYRALRERAATDAEFDVALATAGLTVARERTDRELTADTFGAIVEDVTAEFVKETLGGGDWADALSAAGVKSDPVSDEGAEGEVAQRFDRPPLRRDDPTIPKPIIREMLQAADRETEGRLSIETYERWRQGTNAYSSQHISDNPQSPYDSWTEACEDAGVEPGGRPRGYWTDDDDGQEWSESELQQFLDWLPPTQRADYRAVVIDDQPPAERARERGVTCSTVSTNVSEAKERLREIAEQELGSETAGDDS